MPITRRRRANPPEQPENNNHTGEQPENTTEATPTKQPTTDAPAAPIQSDAVEAEQASMPTLLSSSEHVENPSNTTHISHSVDGVKNEDNENVLYQPRATAPQQPAMNGEHIEKQESTPPIPPTPSIESGRRTARGELFRRPPQPPQIQQTAQPLQPVIAQSAVPPIQAPSHEITLPLGKKPGDTHGDSLHLAYNPGYTGSDEVRSVLLHHLAQESKAGGRARCWSCGSIAIVYERWNTRSKTFGEIGVAMCEICGVWSVM